MTSATPAQRSAQIGSEEQDHGNGAALRGGPTPRLAAVLLPFAFWLALAPQYVFHGNRVSPDSAAYIDCARSIREGQGFQTRVYGGLEPDTWKPIRLWPPGYPILIAGAMTLGLDAHSAALAVSVLCSTLFVVVVLRYYATQLPFAFAVLLAIVFVSMRALLDTGTMCWSEGPYMLLTVFSLMCLMKGTSAMKRTAGWLLVAGLTGGLSWCARNVAVALFASSVCYLVIQFPRLRFKGSAIASCAWLCGWALGSGWLVLWNISTFGTPKPYSMAPSELSFFWNSKATLCVMGRDLTALGRFSHILVNKYVLVALAIAILLIASRRLSARNFVRFMQDHRDRLLLLLFLGFYTLTIVVGRSVYRWGEDINSRHFAPIYWIVLLFVGFSCEWFAAHVWGGRLRARTVLLVGIGLVAVLQIRSSVLRLMGSADETGKEVRSLALTLGREIPESQFVLTDAIAPLRVFGNVNARRPPRPRRDQTPLTWADIAQAGDDGRLWGFVIARSDQYEEGVYGDVLKDISANPGKFPQLREREHGIDVRVFEYVRKDSGWEETRADRNGSRNGDAASFPCARQN